MSSRLVAGEEQVAIADQAREAIIERQEKAFRCTLTSVSRKGKTKWTLYEITPCMVSIAWGLECVLRADRPCSIRNPSSNPSVLH